MWPMEIGDILNEMLPVKKVGKVVDIIHYQ